MDILQKNSSNIDKLLSYPICRVGIPAPQIGEDLGINLSNINIRELLLLATTYNFENDRSISLALINLKIPGLFLGLSQDDIENLDVTDSMLKDLESRISKNEFKPNAKESLLLSFLPENRKSKAQEWINDVFITIQCILRGVEGREVLIQKAHELLLRLNDEHTSLENLRTEAEKLVELIKRNILNNDVNVSKRKKK